MERFVAVDSGKYATKVAYYDKEEDIGKTFRFRTKIGPGDFNDDALETNTIIAGYEGKIFKIGNAAQIEAALETTKATEIHKICTLAAIAMCVG